MATSFYATIEYRKDANFRLTKEIPANLRNMSFSALFDHLKQEADKVDSDGISDKEARMIAKLNGFRKDTFDGIAAELKENEVTEQQYEITIDALMAINPADWQPIQKYDERLDGGRGRPVVDFERQIARYITQRQITTPEKKTLEVPELRIMCDYILVVGNK